ncbi:hypothetical protein IGI37_002081 [Enterococcus sp. AZ194]|uniref:hypothetical protein n=1 Tax=Enterococcus sp. AZ194 TaxID=2774629 RepID=UPI003F279581
MAKAKEEVVVTTEETTEEVTKLEYRTVKGKNFVGFVHPDTRKLITVNEKGRLFVDKTDTKAIAILDAAQDVFLLED